MTLPASIDRQESQERALREASAVRRAIRGARSETNGVLGLAATFDALTNGAAGELLVTRRFAERDPIAAASAMLIAATTGVTITTVAGGAEFELDLAGDGVAALLRRPVASR
ncbi:MAG: hypothetical protein ABJF01_17490 [bacterium]